MCFSTFIGRGEAAAEALVDETKQPSSLPTYAFDDEADVIRDTERATDLVFASLSATLPFQLRLALSHRIVEMLSENGYDMRWARPAPPAMKEQQLISDLKDKGYLPHGS